MLSYILISLFLSAGELINIPDEINIPEVKYPKIEYSKIKYGGAYFSDETTISKILISNINSTVSSLDIAVYSFTNEEISDAIIKAYERGVKVRIIIDYSKGSSSKIDPAVLKLINKKIPIKLLKGSGRYGVMHNKIAIFDRKILMTGSYNFTLAADNNNFENVVFITDENNLSSYIDYFETMWKKAVDIYLSSKLIYNEDFSTSLFTMNEGIRKTLIKLIDGTQKKLDICVYAISDDRIYDSLKKANSRGVKIRIVTDRLQSTQSNTVKKLWSDGFDIKISNGYRNGVMHNKYAIFDDKFVITGSFNWSNNAENYNWENAVVLSAPYVSYFRINFEKIYKQALPLTQQILEQSNSSSSR